MSPELFDALDWAARLKEKVPDFIPTKHASALVEEINRLTKEVKELNKKVNTITEWYEQSPLYVAYRGPIG